MPKFLIEREIPGIGAWSAGQRQKAAEKSRAVLRELGPEIQWSTSCVTGDRPYCVCIAPHPELIREHVTRGGLPYDRVSEVRAEMDPTAAEPGA